MACNNCNNGIWASSKDPLNLTGGYIMGKPETIYCPFCKEGRLKAKKIEMLNLLERKQGDKPLTTKDFKPER